VLLSSTVIIPIAFSVDVAAGQPDSRPGPALDAGTNAGSPGLNDRVAGELELSPYRARLLNLPTAFGTKNGSAFGEWCYGTPYESSTDSSRARG
jgi:hypothetical protein